MTEWEPATDAEIAMRNALRTDDQESYFRILAGVDLLLPVSADALAGLAPLGWGTWSTGGRTHVLAFTSPSALQACLADYTGSARRVAYAELADTWPNLEWWLAVNPGLPVEGYLPAWFVAQLSRGDLRLPTRGPGREGSNAPNRIQDLHAAATLAATAAAQGYNAPAQNYAAPASGGPMQGSPMPGSPATSGAPSGGVAPSGATAGGPGSGGPAYGGGAAAGTGARGYGGRGPGGSDSSGAAGDSPYRRPGSGGAASGGASSDRPASGGVGSGGPAYGGAGQSGSGAQAFAGSGGPANAGVSPGGSTPAAGTTSAASPYAAGAATEGRPAAGPGAAPSSSASPADAGQVGPGGLPLRTPGAVLPSGLPSRVPGAPAGADGGIPGGQFNGFGTRPVSQPGEQSSQPQGPASAQPSALQEQAGGPRPTAGDVPAAYRPPTLPAREAAAPGTPARSASGPSALSALGSRSPGSVSERATPPSSPPPASPPPALQRLDAPLPTRTPMAQTPPLPAHIPPPSEQEADGAEPDGDAVRDLPDESQTASGGLPRRQMPPAEKPPSAMAAAAQALAGTRSPGAPQTPVTTRQPGLAPPVIPGAAGAGRGTTPPIVPAAAARPTIPPTRPEPAEQRPAVRPDPQPAAPAADVEDDFIPANEVERDLLHAVDEGSTDAFLSTLLLATVHVPVADNSRPGSAPGESGFAFRTEEFDGEVFLVVFTSRDRLGEHFAEPTRTVGVRFVDLIRNWPDPAWSFAVNPTSPIGARYPGPQVIALAAWAVEAGLGGEPVDAPVEQPQRPAEPTAQLTIMQKAVPAEQIDYYLERGYDRIAGFVHRAGEVEHLRSPGDLFAALGLLYDGSPYQGDAKEAFVLRWPAHRPSLYRIPYGGQSEQALRAMDGWVIERPPFRGNGFAPGEGKDVIAEFKVDSVRLPHGAQLWRMDADGDDQMIAVFDCDAPVWRRVGGQ